MTPPSHSRRRENGHLPYRSLDSPDVGAAVGAAVIACTVPLVEEVVVVCVCVSGGTSATVMPPLRPQHYHHHQALDAAAPPPAVPPSAAAASGLAYDACRSCAAVEASHSQSTSTQEQLISDERQDAKEHQPDVMRTVMQWVMNSACVLHLRQQTGGRRRKRRGRRRRRRSKGRKKKKKDEMKMGKKSSFV